MDFKKNEKGITLIALAVTIVVLLILAGVTISSVFSENGIIKKAQQAETKMEEAKNKDLQALNELEKELAKYQGENINLEDYETLTLKAYVGRFQRQCVNYLRVYVEIYDLENEENSVIFNVGTDWKENIDTSNDLNKLFVIDQDTNLEMVQNVENLKSYEYNTSTQTMDRMLLNAFTDVELTFKAKKDMNYGINIVVQGAKGDNGNNIKKVNVTTYNGEWGEENERIITRDDEIGGTKIYAISDDSAILLPDATMINLIASGYYRYSEHSFQISNETGKYALKLMNEKGTGAIDEDYIGLDFNRDGYIDYIDANYIQLVTGGVARW